MLFNGKPKEAAEKVEKCPRLARLALGIVTFVATTEHG